jgi:hypothetical protein
MIQDENTMLKCFPSIRPNKFCEYMELTWQRL